MKAVVRALALVLFWSSGFIGAELGARAAGPATVLAWRFLVTAVVMLPWLLRASARLDLWEWMRQAVLALLCQCLYLAGVFWAAAAGVPAGTSALIASLQPALVLTAAVLLGSQRLKLGHVAGLILGSTGVALTAAADLRAGLSITALALPASAMLCLTIGTLLQQRWSAPARNSTPLMQTLAIQAVFSAGFFTAYTAAAGELAPPPTAQFWTATAWATLAGIGSYGLYYLVTTRDGAARASTLLYLTPAATALWATLMFAQPLRPTAVIGLLVSAVAVLVLNTAGTPRAGERPGTLTWSSRAKRAGEGTKPADQSYQFDSGTVTWGRPANHRETRDAATVKTPDVSRRPARRMSAPAPAASSWTSTTGASPSSFPPRSGECG